jgi:hypothetical protein
MNRRTRGSRTLYPPGHAPFIPREGLGDDRIADQLRAIATEPRLLGCLHSAQLRTLLLRLLAEELRAYLFRAEHLIETQPLVMARDHRDLAGLPSDLRALLESLNAAKRCVEEWLESQTCAAMMRLTREEGPP